MESMRKRIDVRLVSCPKTILKLINRPTFKYCTSYNDNLVAVTLQNKIINFCKPIYVGFTVLEISKTLMYNYHYNVMKKHYNEAIKLMYTDTGIQLSTIIKYYCIILIIYIIFMFNYMFFLIS